MEDLGFGFGIPHSEGQGSGFAASGLGVLTFKSKAGAEQFLAEPLVFRA